MRFTQDGKPFTAESIGSRQQFRAEFRKRELAISFKYYASESRQARRLRGMRMANLEFKKWRDERKDKRDSFRTLNLLTNG